MTYDGFISYSHAADDLLAPRLQSGLQRFAKRMLQLRALRIFRDEASLAANPHLWSSIVEALDQSEWFVLLLSPDAAQSEWVGREIEHWKQHKDPARILPVVTAGTFGWDNGDVAGDAVPPALSGVFGEEPRWVDLRWARTDEQLDLKNPRFSAAVADIASAIRGVPKDELESEEVKQHRRTRRTAWAAVIVVLLLGMAATIGALVAVNQSNEAQAQRDAARASELTAQSVRVRSIDAELAAILAVEAVGLTDVPLSEALDALHAAVQGIDINSAFEWPATLPTSQSIAVAVSPDGTQLAATSDGEVVLLLDPESLELEGELGDRQAVASIESLTGFPNLSFSPDGDLIANVDYTGTLRVRNVRTGEAVFTFELVPSQDALVGNAFFSPDGSYVIGAVPDRSQQGAARAFVFETKQWAHVSTLEAGALSQAGFAIFPDSRRFVTGTWAVPPDPVAIIRVHDLATGAILNERREPVAIGSLAVSPDGLLIAEGQEGGVIVLRNSTTLEPVRHLFGHTGTVLGLHFTSDGRLFSAGSASAFIWDVATGRSLRELGPAQDDLSLHLDSETLITGGPNRTIRSWNVGEVSAGELLNIDDLGEVFALDVANDNASLAAMIRRDGEHSLRVWDLPSGTPRFERHDVSRFSQGLAFSPNGGELLVQADNLGPVVILDARTGDVIGELHDSAGAERYFFDFAHDGSSVVVGGLDQNSARLYSMPDGRLMREFAHPTWVSAVATNIDGTMIATGDCVLDGTVRVFDSESGDLVSSMSHPTCMLGVDMSADGSVVVSGSGDGGLRVWDARSGDILHDLELGSIHMVRISNDGRFVASGGADGTVRVFDIESGAQHSAVTAFESLVWGLDWLPGSKYRIAAGDQAGRVRFFTLETDELMEVARRRLTRGPTTVECETYGLDPCPTLDELSSGS